MQTDTAIAPTAPPEGLSQDEFHELLVKNDWNQIAPERRAPLLAAMCRSLGLNPLTNPIQLVAQRGGGLRPYATKGCAEQLRMLRGVSIRITQRETSGDVHFVTAEAKTPDGRSDVSMGAVSVAGCRGEDLANAFMKAETKAKRRATLSICGLGMLDESELESAGSDGNPSRRSGPPPAAPTPPPAAPPASVMVEQQAPAAAPQAKEPPPVIEADFTEAQAEDEGPGFQVMSLEELGAWARASGLTRAQVGQVVESVGGPGAKYLGLTDAQKVEVALKLGDLVGVGQ